MMIRNQILCARAGAFAIAATLALSPIHATVPKPIVDLSKSPALSGKPPPAPKKRPTKPQAGIGSLDEQTLELGGGAIVLLALGAGAFALSRRKSREDAEWQEEDEAVAEQRDPLFDEPMFKDEPISTEASAFAWGNSSSSEEEGADGRLKGETWVERAYRGPTPDNPSHSLKTRLKRAAFFDKRERDAAAGRAVPIEPDAGLPEAIADERAHETV